MIPKAGQAGVVEEFFELFKTPWEFYRPGQVYDVVIATAEEVPECKTRLLLVYGATPQSRDAPLGAVVGERHRSAIVNAAGTELPIYCGLLTFAEGGSGASCVKAGPQIAGLVFETSDSTVMRLGYDLFEEAQFLISAGQPIEQASIPTLDIHIRMLREWILQAWIPLLEIPPAPAGHDFVVCLTHDIDFVGIRNHKFDHTMWGFLYRATAGALYNFLRGRLSLKRLFRSWLSAASLPLVFAGWAKDFWEPFEWYLKVEKGLPSTYFLIPFKRRVGDKVQGSHASRRAAASDISDLPQWTETLRSAGCELGVHGIDAWHSPDKGRDELAKLTAATGEFSIGIRMHWLLRDANTPSVLEQAGYVYDSTFGYNETVGYRAGTSQVFRPLGVQTLLELPMHIQDGALFYPQRLGLSEPEAEKRCQVLIDNARRLGGVLTLLWHDRSHGPERFWGDFYIALVQELTSRDAWFGTAGQVVGWFRKRRDVSFQQVGTSSAANTRLCYQGGEIQPPLKIRIHMPARPRSPGEPIGNEVPRFTDIPWNGKSVDQLDLRIEAVLSFTHPGPTVFSHS